MPRRAARIISKRRGGAAALPRRRRRGVRAGRRRETGGIGPDAFPFKRKFLEDVNLRFSRDWQPIGEVWLSRSPVFCDECPLWGHSGEKFWPFLLEYWPRRMMTDD